MKSACVSFLAMTVLCAACGTNATTPSTPATPTSTATPVVKQLSISGNTALTAIGQTSQLKAVATLSDASTKDVTATALWMSADPSLMTVSPGGLVTVQRLGATAISGQYQSYYADVLMKATPAGTFTVGGFVDEPGAGGIAGVRVTDSASAVSAQSGATGAFSLAGLLASQVHLTFEKTGYEPSTVDATPDASISARIQAVIRVAAGETVTAHRLAPNDLSYAVGAGQRCNSCRLIRVVSPAKGTLHLRVTWANDCAAITLGIWNAGQHVVPSNAVNTEVAADAVVDAGETIFYVDRVVPAGTTCHVPFVVATTLVQ